MSEEIKNNEVKNTETKTFEKKEYKPRDNRESSSRPYKKRAPRRKICRFCAEGIPVDYTNARLLKTFITERAKIVPARITGTCAKHQRELTVAIKRARKIALVPYTSSHFTN